MAGLDRRTVLAMALGLSACGARAVDAPGEIAPLKSLSPFPLGVCVMTGQLDEPQWTQLAHTHFDRLTPEWEMKAEAFFMNGPREDFSRADRIVDWARQQGMGVFGHTPVWYSQVPDHFTALAASAPQRFRDEYRAYVGRVIGHWRGQLAGWDVVNEPVTDEGSTLRDCLWSQQLGHEGYVIEAFRAARSADPGAPLLINEYNLETNARKLATYQRLIEACLNAGAPIDAIGTQTHVDCELAPGAISATVRELARFGLPVHISEIDVSTRYGDARRQPAIYAEAAEAMAALPERQRFGLTVWGLRDSDSWLVRDRRRARADAPLLFNGAGQPKPAAAALGEALARI